MGNNHRETFLRNARPLAPLPTSRQPMRCAIDGIRAVLFDVYGTLLVTAADDVAARRGASADAFQAALLACGITQAVDGYGGATCLVRTIRRHQGELRVRGTEHPEVDIIAVWKCAIDDLLRQGRLPAAAREIDVAQLAVEYEVRVNPVWLMPHARDSIATLRSAGVVLGLISNAQFYTPELLAALFDDSLTALGFDSELQYYSYRHGHAKPGTYLFELARRELAQRGIRPGEALYVGNDMLNDILPAKQIGYRTALFAGDRRSFSSGGGDPRVRGVVPDIVIIDLRDVVDCLSLSGRRHES